MEVDSVGIIAILSISYITTRIVKCGKLSVVKTSIKFFPCIMVSNRRIIYCCTNIITFLIFNRNSEKT